MNSNSHNKNTNAFTNAFCFSLLTFARFTFDRDSNNTDTDNGSNNKHLVYHLNVSIQ